MQQVENPSSEGVDTKESSDTLDLTTTKKQPDPTSSLSRVALRGVAWLTAATLANKFTALGSQIALAWLLMPDDFGLIGLAYTVGSFAQVIQKLGVGTILVQRGPRIRLWATAAFWMSMLLGLIGGMGLLAAAPIASAMYNEPRVFGLLLFMAINAPISALGLVPSSILATQLRFRLQAIMGVTSNLSITLLTLLFAWLGLGAYSFILPLPIVGLFGAFVGFRITRPHIRLNPQFRRWKYIIRDSLLISVTNLLGAISGQGDYIILGIMASTAVVGQYYFAFSLSTQTIALFTTNLMSILFTTLSSIREQPQRQIEAFIRSTRLLNYIVIPLCLLQAVLAEPIVELLFNDRWEPAIPLLQILSLGMAWRSISWTAGALMQAQNRFFARTILIAVATAVLIGLMLVGTILAGPIGTALAVLFNVLMFSPITLAVAVRRSRPLFGDLVLVPTLLTMLPAALAFLACTVLNGPTATQNVIRLITGGAVFALCYGILLYCVRPQILSELIRLLPLRGTWVGAIIDMAAKRGSVL